MNTTPELKIFTRNFVQLEELRKNWGWFLFLGLVLIGIGTFAVATSTFVTLVSMIFLGTMLLVSGVIQIAYSFWMRKWGGFFVSLLAGILYTTVGAMLAIHPAESALSITLLLGAFYIVGGIFRIVASLMTRFDQWGWAFFSGVVKLVLGFLILAGWPATGLWVLGLFIGIDLIFFGWFWVLLALGARNVPSRSRQHR